MSRPESDRPPRDRGGSQIEIERLRARIDAVDDAILARLNERAELVAQVGRAKEASGSAVYEPTRERRIVERLGAGNPGPFPSAGLAPVFREIISATRSLEESIRVAYLGPEGTFSHEAAREHFGALAVLCGVASISDVFAAVEAGRAQLGIVPVENTTEGVVTQTLDAFGERDVNVCAERVLRVSHSLLSKSGRVEDVRRVISHPQPLAQCRRWLDSQLPGVERVESASTAAAAQRAAEDPECAAIGSLLSAEVYHLTVVAARIEDRRDNSTRFLVIGGDPPPPSGRDLTSIVFTIRRDESGALLRLIEPFAREGVNLTSIQLRPIVGKPWEYLFFIDCEGHRSEAAVHRALESAGRVAHSTRVLGSFPRAEVELVALPKASLAQRAQVSRSEPQASEDQNVGERSPSGGRPLA
jgi:chorismate mutase / prephenate dehydratase